MIYKTKQNDYVKERFLLCKVYGYCRTALADEEEIQRRIELIKKYCEDNGLSLEKCFYDDGVNGFDIGEDFKQLMRELENDDMVVIRDPSQLSRSSERLLMLMGQFDHMGVKIVYVNGGEVRMPSIAEWIEKRLAR